jgi:hypothetical protein
MGTGTGTGTGTGGDGDGDGDGPSGGGRNSEKIIDNAILGEIQRRSGEKVVVVATVVGAVYKLNPVYPQLESAWFQPLSL